MWSTCKEFSENVEDCRKVFPSLYDRRRKYILILILLLLSTSLVIGWNYYDIMWWISWYRILEKNGPLYLFSLYRLCRVPTCKVPYPPIAVIMFVSIYALAMIMPYQLRYAILKLILVVVPAYIIFKVIRKSRGFEIALLWLLSLPFLQILFALQFDVLVALFVLLSTLYIWSGKHFKAAASLAIATLIKPIVAVIAILHMIFLYRRGGFRKVIEYIAIALVIGLAITTPFIVASGKNFVENVISFHATRPPQDASPWAIATFVLESNITKYNNIIDNLWTIPFVIALSFTVLGFIIIMRQKPYVSLRFLALSTSILLLLTIVFGKIGNTNYLVWIVPTSIIALDCQILRKFYLLTTLLVLLVSVPMTGIMLYLAPAVSAEPTFMAEDLGYWDARTLFMQSINYYIIYALSIFQQYSLLPIRIVAPSDFLETINYITTLIDVKKICLVGLVILAQILLMLLLILHYKSLYGETSC
ncbi:glycosyltransferase 87 family protein [Ignisphaera sp. 4213-co]|uniref:Glycosyltransferase 87 family protein n=1 Tax=Ignisphaera cupida TaxID=3050454 RepID=A0ABD4Z9N9_9CREN|nr:glycosyltransferase 87 family protein [Ignisphaera sp. 4213-co]MDK6029283.1 glycosyltransferase 87 family protein [Ignisphaera sp. 4213-co]